MAKRLSAARIYALKGFTIRTEKQQFFICPTAYFSDAEKWAGPYKSLISATNAIAKQLRDEFNRRDSRRLVGTQ